jgi:DNA gyrase subunit B
MTTRTRRASTPSGNASGAATTAAELEIVGDTGDTGAPSGGGSSYSADNLTVLEGLDAVRKRPGMYIGSTDSRGLQHCLWEIIDNAVDEALAGHCTHITVTLHADGSVEVDDDGRGIPVDVNAQTGLSGIELVMTKLHAGGKFGGGSYGSSGGLHGVGASVVNALSERLDVTVERAGSIHQLSFNRGVAGQWNPDGTFTAGSALHTTAGEKHAPARTGTRVRYWPDRQIFLAEATLDLERTLARARQTAFLVPGLTLEVTDQRPDAGTEGRWRFAYDGGISDYVEHLTVGRALTDVLTITGEGAYSETVPVLDGETLVNRQVERTMRVQVALRWDTGYDTCVKSFVNIVETPKGGTHVAGFERALNRAVNDALRTAKLLKVNDESVVKDDVQEGLVACILVHIEEPQFEGQTKEILGTSAAQQIVFQTVLTGMRDQFADKKRRDQLRRALQKIAEAAKTRKAARLHKETLRKKNAVESSTLPAKLADCTGSDTDRTELLIVEGDSAAGCFTGDTRILIAAAHSDPADRRVEAVSFIDAHRRQESGEELVGFACDNAGNLRTAPLRDIRRTRRDTPLWQLVLSGGEDSPDSQEDTDRVLRCTGDHLFRLADGRWLRADQLSVGERITTRLADGTTNGITADTEQSLTVTRTGETGERADVWDLTVDGLHNFTLACGAIVHNSTKGGRDSEFQAVLPIRGKILNTLRATERKMLDNRECADLISAVGAGSGRSFDLDAIRYGKIVLVMDADVDGSHIRCLLLTLIYRYMTPLLEDGRVFSAVPPLHKIMFEDRKAPPEYTYTDAELTETLTRLAAAGRKVKDVQRYKGLGEMSAEQLAETTLDPDVRKLRQITMADAAEAADLFDILMGDDVPRRRDYIFTHSDLVDVANLDI